MLLRNWSHKLNKERKSQTQTDSFFIQETGTVMLKIKKDVQDGGNIWTPNLRKKSEEDCGIFEVTAVSRCQCGHVDTTTISSKEFVGSVLFDVMSPLALMCFNAVAYINRHDNSVLVNTYEKSSENLVQYLQDNFCLLGRNEEFGKSINAHKNLWKEILDTDDK